MQEKSFFKREEGNAESKSRIGLRISKNKKEKKVFNEEEKKEKRKKIYLDLADWFVKMPLYILVALLPMFIYFNVPSPFELNKQFLLVILVGISALTWIGKMAWKNEIKFRKNFLLIPALTFLLIYGLSTVFAEYYEQSMWGYFGGESRAFVSVLFLVTFFILVYNNIKSYEGVVKFILSFLIGSFLLVSLGVLQFFEVYLVPLDFVQNKFFNPIGSVYVYSIFVSAVFLVSVTMFLSRVSKRLKFAFLLLSLLSFFILTIISFKMIWVVLLIMLAFILGITILIENKNAPQARIIPMIFLVFVLFFVLRAKPLINSPELPIEVFIKHKTGAEIALSSFRESPLLGSGPASFGNVYKKYRPEDLGDFSLVNFNESTSFFLTLASTTGILGVLSFLFLVISGLIMFFKEMTLIIKNSEKRSNVHSYLGLSIGVGWLFLTIALFLYFVNLSVLMLWWFFFSLLVSISFLNRSKEEKEASEIVTTSQNPKTSFFFSFGFVLVIIGFIAVVYLQSQKYIAAAYYNQALKASGQENDIQKSADRMSKAVSLDPNRDIFFRDLAMIHLALAKEKIIEKGLNNLTAEEANFVSSRFTSALQALNQAKNLNPSNSDNFVAVASLYEEFIVIKKDSGEDAIENYQKAIELDPKNPNIYQSMANVQITLADLETMDAVQKNQNLEQVPQKSLEYLNGAEKYLRKSLEIKPNHVASNILLVAVYEKMGEEDKAIQKAEENKEIFPGAPEVLVDLGRLYYQKESYTEAKENFQAALNLNPNYANARYLLGLVLDAENDKEAALEQFEKIKENNPDNELLDQIINNLKTGQKALSGIGQNQNQENFQEVQPPAEEVEPLTETNEIPTEEVNSEELIPEEQPKEQLEEQPEEENPEEIN